MQIKDVRRILKIRNKDIARMFGYKNVNSYQKSSRKKHIENGIIEIFKKCSDVEND